MTKEKVVFEKNGTHYIVTEEKKDEVVSYIVYRDITESFVPIQRFHTLDEAIQLAKKLISADGSNLYYRR